MLRLRCEFDSRLGRCCSVGQRTCLRRTLTAEWRVVLARDRDQAVAMALLSRRLITWALTWNFGLERAKGIEPFMTSLECCDCPGCGLHQPR